MNPIEWRTKELIAKAAIRALKMTGWYTGYWNFWRGDLFDHAETNGLHILPVHYYTPIPRTQSLPESLWADERPDPPGLPLQTDRALEMLDSLANGFRSEYDGFVYDKPAEPQRFYLANAAYTCGDAEILYALIRQRKPRRIIEVGSGYTTLLIAEAIGRNLQDDPSAGCEFVAVEPYPPEYLKPLPKAVTRMLPTGVQSVPPEEFAALGDGDILFIDSSHITAIGSDVNHLFLEVLPRLAPGVIVHVHDVFIPFEYPRAWIRQDRFFWNEQYLLHAFLLGNSGFEVLIPTHAVFRRHRERFHQLIPSCSRHACHPGSFWMRRRSAD